MKTLLGKICLLTATVLMMASCLKTEDKVTYPQCAITSFSVGTITTTFHTTTKDGLNDSTYTRVIDGKSIYFNIDQVKGTIESVDSIISWADISRVVTTVTYNGYIFCKQRGWDDYYNFVSGTDSVDYTKDVEFLVVSTDGANSKTYTVKFNQAKLNKDSLYLADRSSLGLKLDGPHRTLAVGSTIYVFAENGGTPTVTSLDTDADKPWTTPQVLTGCSDGTLDYRSVVVFKGVFYALSTDGTLYRSLPAVEGVAWTKASDQKLQRLLCADDVYLYGYDGSAIIMTSDLETWTANGTTDLSQLPVSPVACISFDTKTNAELENVLMLGLTDPVGDYAAVWYKVSAANAESNQQWNYIPVASDNAYGLPAMQNLSLVRLGDKLLAFGGADPSTGDTSEAYRYLYASTDNGLSWYPYSANVMLPADLHAHPELPASGVAIDNHLWIVQSGGKVWEGMVGKTDF
jgi:hypothetical protein